MKQSLQLRLGQTLTMTPQLQQAIRLLQLSTLELHMEVQQALDSNLMLEPAEDADDGVEERETEANGDEQTAAAESETAQAESVRDAAEREVNESSSNSSNDDIPKDLPLDSEWGDIYDGTTS